MKITEEIINKWREFFAEFEDSGLGKREFCRLKGISKNTFYRWRKIIENGYHEPVIEGSVIGEPEEFLEVEVYGDDVAHSITSGLSLSLFSKATFNIDPDFDEYTLRRLLNVVRTL